MNALFASAKNVCLNIRKSSYLCFSTLGSLDNKSYSFFIFFQLFFPITNVKNTKNC